MNRVNFVYYGNFSIRKTTREMKSLEHCYLLVYLIQVFTEIFTNIKF